MSIQNDFVFKKTIEHKFSRKDVEGFLEMINSNRDEQITIKEVLENEKLLDFICSQALNLMICDDGTTFVEPMDVWDCGLWDDEELDKLRVK